MFKLQRESYPSHPLKFRLSIVVVHYHGNLIDDYARAGRWNIVLNPLQLLVGEYT